MSTRNDSRPPRGRPGGGDREAEAAMLAELDAIYREVDALYAGYSCEQSTECCRFGVTGREPYLTSIELRRVERAIARRGGRLAGKPPSPLASRSLPVVRDERACPLLGADGRCTIYADRPFGCRTFWCERASFDAPVRHKQMSELLARLKLLSARHAPGGDQGRPLTRVVGAGSSASGPKTPNRNR